MSRLARPTASALCLGLVTVGLSVVAAAPAAADPLSELFDPPTSTETSMQTSTQQAGVSTATGSTSAANGRLRRGCHTYRFSYALDVPVDEWTLETSVIDRQGNAVASHAYMGPAHPTAQEVGYSLCRWSTVPGKFRIRAKMYWYDGETELGFTKLPVTRFRLRAPRS